MNTLGKNSILARHFLGADSRGEGEFKACGPRRETADDYFERQKRRTVAEFGLNRIEDDLRALAADKETLI